MFATSSVLLVAFAAMALDHTAGNGSGYILHPGTYTSFPAGNKRQLSFLPGIYCITGKATIGSQVLARSVDAGYPQ